MCRTLGLSVYFCSRGHLDGCARQDTIPEKAMHLRFRLYLAPVGPFGALDAQGPGRLTNRTMNRPATLELQHFWVPPKTNRVQHRNSQAECPFHPLLRLIWKIN